MRRTAGQQTRRCRDAEEPRPWYLLLVAKRHSMRGDVAAVPIPRWTASMLYWGKRHYGPPRESTFTRCPGMLTALRGQKLPQALGQIATRLPIRGWPAAVSSPFLAEYELAEREHAPHRRHLNRSTNCQQAKHMQPSTSALPTLPRLPASRLCSRRLLDGGGT